MENWIWDTDTRSKKEETEMAVYTEYQRLVSEPGKKKMATMVIKYLMEKFSIKSPSTVYSILKRVEGRLKEEQA